jgi:carboxypeptidase Q
VMMEVMRIFKQLEIKPRRTIRIGLWGGEEQMFDGSLGYAKKHLADLLGDGKAKEELSRISVYFNHDTGDGKIRGVFLQGNEVLRDFFTECFKPFNYLGVETVSARNSFGTDHVIFDALNIPAFEFIQDPSLYESHQWHTNMDVTDLITEDNLKLNAVLIASLVYQVAMRDEMFPRKIKADN